MSCSYSLCFSAGETTNRHVQASTSVCPSELPDQFFSATSGLVVTRALDTQQSPEEDSCQF